MRRCCFGLIKFCILVILLIYILCSSMQNNLLLVISKRMISNFYTDMLAVVGVLYRIPCSCLAIFLMSLFFKVFWVGLGGHTSWPRCIKLLLEYFTAKTQETPAIFFSIAICIKICQSFSMAKKSLAKSFMQRGPCVSKRGL